MDRRLLAARGRAADPDTLDLEVDRSRFEDFVWPELRQRVPAFESVRLLDAWAGHYEVNTLDHNAVIGPHPELPGFLFANGFSGHGLQQAPAVGRGLAEWIATGRYETLDLSPLGYERSAAQRADSRAQRGLINRRHQRQSSASAPRAISSANSPTNDADMFTCRYATPDDVEMAYATPSTASNEPGSPSKWKLTRTAGPAGRPTSERVE